MVVPYQVSSTLILWSVRPAEIWIRLDGFEVVRERSQSIDDIQLVIGVATFRKISDH